LADLCYVTIDEIFHLGLHEYLDRIQGRLIEISNAIYEEFCEWLENEDDEATQLQKQSQ
jgi:hypothetical protein